MKVSLLSKRFAELAQQLAPIESSKSRETGSYGEYFSVDTQLLLSWRVKARNLLVLACGKDSEHYREFLKTEEPQSYRDSWEESQQLSAIFMAAKEDYEGGYMTSVRNLVQAEVFSDELEQAKELLKSGYSAPAAVVAGVVLETTLRQLCTDRGLPHGKLDKMNADLAKASAYSLLVQKRITALADVRNNAAHGHSSKFTENDVVDMIAYVENFVADAL